MPVKTYIYRGDKIVTAQQHKADVVLVNMPFTQTKSAWYTLVIDLGKKLMSTESIDGFFEEVINESALQDQLRNASDRESFVKEAVALAKNIGYSFTAEELDDAIQEAAENQPLESTRVGFAIQQLRINKIVGC
jgi:predicted ribosomally synthesized peptide with nif11-like leader